VRRADPWDCGFPEQSNRMQDTADAFGQPIAVVFGPLYLMKRHLPGPEDGAPKYSIKVEDRHWGWVYLPVARLAEFVSAKVGLLQRGRISTYLLYSFLRSSRWCLSDGRALLPSVLPWCSGAAARLGEHRRAAANRRRRALPALHLASCSTRTHHRAHHLPIFRFALHPFGCMAPPTSFSAAATCPSRPRPTSLLLVLATARVRRPGNGHRHVVRRARAARNAGRLPRRASHP
jgi:hypothetical protein